MRLQMDQEAQQQRKLLEYLEQNTYVYVYFETFSYSGENTNTFGNASYFQYNAVTFSFVFTSDDARAKSGFVAYVHGCKFQNINTH